MERQTDGWTDKQTDRQTNRRMDRLCVIPMYPQNTEYENSLLETFQQCKQTFLKLLLSLVD